MSHKTYNAIYKGATRTLTLSDWAKLIGCHRTTLLGRIQRGWQFQHAIDTPVKRAKSKQRFTHRNQTRTLRQWADKTGIPASTLHSRIYVLNWPVDRALTTGDGRRVAESA